MLLFSALWLLCVYIPVTHWVWGGGWLYKMGLYDFAGGVVVHITAGVGALVAALVLGPRRGFPKVAMPPHNMTMVVTGAGMLWVGWFGFNGGSQLALGSKGDIDGIAMVIADTNMAAAAGAIMAAILTQLIYKKVDLTMVLNGTLAGLVSCTAGPDLGMMVAFIEGIVGGALVVFAVPMFDKMKIDDPVGALSVHLVAGIWGTLAVGIFNPDVTIMAQVKGIVVIGAFVFISSFIVWKILDLVVGLRVSEEVEVQGLDIHETGLEAYPEFKRA
jgi:Amt family ammonium transporter